MLPCAIKPVTNAFWTIWAAASRGFYSGGSKRTIEAHPRKRAHCSRVSSHITRPWEETECTHWCSWPFRKHGTTEGEGGVWEEEEEGGLLPARVPLSRLQMSSSTSSRWQQLSVRSLLNKAFSNRPKTTFCLTPKTPAEVLWSSAENHNIKIII